MYKCVQSRKVAGNSLSIYTEETIAPFNLLEPHVFNHRKRLLIKANELHIVALFTVPPFEIQTKDSLAVSWVAAVFFFLNNGFVSHTFSSQGIQCRMHDKQWILRLSESVKFQMGELILPTSLPQREGKLASWVVNFLWIMQLAFLGLTLKLFRVHIGW